MQDTFSLETLMDALSSIGAPSWYYAAHSVDEVLSLARRGAPPAYVILVRHGSLMLDEAERQARPPDSLPVAFTRTQTLIGVTGEYFPDGTVYKLHAAPIDNLDRLDMKAMMECSKRQSDRPRGPGLTPAAQEAPPSPN